jgi:hypothetical protein
MAEQSWTIRLEFVCDQAENGKNGTSIEVTGELKDNLCPVNELIAIDMSKLMQMFLKSGFCVSDFKGTVEALGDF